MLRFHPPYYAVIFTSVQTGKDKEGYDAMSKKMLALAKEQPGFLGVESARETIGITISYWESLTAIAQWKHHTTHLMAQQRGRATWYRGYNVRICRVAREYGFDEDAKV